MFGHFVRIEGVVENSPSDSRLALLNCTGVTEHINNTCIASRIVLVTVQVMTTFCNRHDCNENIGSVILNRESLHNPSNGEVIEAHSNRDLSARDT